MCPDVGPSVPRPRTAAAPRDTGPVDAAPGLITPPGLARTTFAAMGTTVSVLAPADRPDAPALIESLFATWEQTLSRFRADSELSRLNARAGETVPVGALLFAVTRTALDAAAATGGLFDPALLRQLVAVGYDRSFEALPAFAPAARGLPTPGGAWRDVALDADARTIRLPAGTMLDFGGIAKGMAVDAALAALVAAGAVPAAVEAGGDLAMTATPPGAAPWLVAIEAVHGDPASERPIELEGGAVATSGTGRRRWRQGDVERHHLIDPRSGLPSASELQTVSVIASACAQAEVAAKATLLLGADAGADFVESLGLSALLVDRTGAPRLIGRWEPPRTEEAA